MHWRVFNSIDGLYLLGARAPLVMTTKTISGYCQISPEEHIAPVKNHCYDE